MTESDRPSRNDINEAFERMRVICYHRPAELRRIEQRAENQTYDLTDRAASQRITDEAERRVAGVTRELARHLAEEFVGLGKLLKRSGWHPDLDAEPGEDSVQAIVAEIWQLALRTRPGGIKQIARRLLHGLATIPDFFQRVGTVLDTECEAILRAATRADHQAELDADPRQHQHHSELVELRQWLDEEKWALGDAIPAYAKQHQEYEVKLDQYHRLYGWFPDLAPATLDTPARLYVECRDRREALEAIESSAPRGPTRPPAKHLQPICQAAWDLFHAHIVRQAPPHDVPYQPNSAQIPTVGDGINLCSTLMQWCRDAKPGPGWKSRKSEE